MQIDHYCTCFQLSLLQHTCKIVWVRWLKTWRSRWGPPPWLKRKWLCQQELQIVQIQLRRFVLIVYLWTSPGWNSFGRFWLLVRWNFGDQDDPTWSIEEWLHHFSQKEPLRELRGPKNPVAGGSRWGREMEVTAFGQHNTSIEGIKQIQVVYVTGTRPKSHQAPESHTSLSIFVLLYKLKIIYII